MRHRLFSACMALLVLITSVGLTVQSHTCRSSGRSTAAIVFSAPAHKCPPASGAGPLAASHQLAGKAQLKKGCCEFGTHFHKLEAASHALEQAKHLVASLDLAWLATDTWPLFTPAQRVAQATGWHASDSSPPLRAGRQLLAFVCTWQV
ncbi:hypothetical protein E5K00_09105 [Hymenobacter aquaticus]|uniref:Uncharacterized protein n=1 Tax=Hymenobacter aquaticus TaxID=1867101 RepID=A0A4Z0Q5F7_9BACT|nr:hypothetical protein [Hymenobacter aquaticus]TGE25328.1 hypothetical protein E5K00_09105 [Hymenobacter aquaticus]